MQDSLAASAVPRYPALDELRGFAVVSVVVFHCLLSTPLVTQNPVDRTIDLLGMLLLTTLDLFFVISGFLITLILDRTRNADHTIRTFYFRRALRIVPLYYGFLAFAALFLHDLGPRAMGAPGAMKWEWLFLTNVPLGLGGPKNVGSLFPHFWSLAVEEHFYLVWPWVVILTPPAKMVRLSLLLALTTCAARFLLTAQGHGYAAWVLTPTRLDGLAAGSMVAMLHRYHPAILERWSRRVFAIFAGLTPVFFVTLYFLVFRFRQTALTPDVSTALTPFWSTITFASLVGYLAGRNTPRPKPSVLRELLRNVARYSYGMYAFHVPIIVFLFIRTPILHGYATRGYEFPYRLYFSACIVVMSYALGFLSWHLFEKQVLKLAPRYRYGSKRAAPTQVRAEARAMPVP